MSIAEYRRSARLAAKYGSEEPKPKKMTAGELRAASVRAARAAAAAAAPPPPRYQYPPDAPPMELALTIRIPIRTFPAANQEEKNKSINTIRGYLERFEASTKEQRVLVAVDLYNEIIRQPLLAAHNVRFRNQTIQTLNTLAQEIKDNGMHQFYVDAFEDLRFDYNEMLGDLLYHPWWTPDPLDG